MLINWLCMSFLILVVQDVTADISNIDVSKFDMMYYDPNTRLGLKGELEIGRVPLSRIAFHGVGCNCGNLTCGCCTGINITAFNFDHHACTNFTYVPEDFAIKLKFIVNEKVLTTGTISAKNPPPLCLPLYLPFVSFCVRFFDVYTSGSNLRACIDFETRVVSWPILVLHFDCIKIGVDGISWTKPENTNSVLQVAKPETAESSGPEIFDDVNFESDSTELPSNQTLNLKPEEEDNIGQLKL